MNWNKDTITGAELFDELVKQYGSTLTVSISVDPGDVISYKSAMLPYTCNRCGNKSSSSPFLLLTALEKRGAICTKCSSLTDADIKKRKEDARNQAALEIARENGEPIDDAPEPEIHHEQQTTVNRTEEDLEDLLAKTDDSGNDVVVDDEYESIDESTEKTTDETPPEVVEQQEFSEEEFAAAYNDSIKKLTENLGFPPFAEKFNFEDEGFTTNCFICGNDVRFSNFEELESVVEVNVSGRIIKTHNCKHCIESLKQYGFIQSFKDRIYSAVEKRGGFVVENKLALFNSPIEKHRIGVKGCDGVYETLSIHDFMTKYGSMQDIAPSFRAKFDKIAEEHRKTQQAESVKAKATESKPKGAEVNTKVSPLVNAASNIQYSATIKGVDQSTDTLSQYEKERAEAQAKAQEEQIFKDEPKIDTAAFATVTAAVNPFQFDQSLTDEFKNSSFYPFIEDVARITGTDYKLIINEHTLEIPFIDFATGIRLICVDLDDRSLYNVPFENIANRAYFSYKGVEYKWLILYSDSVQYRRTATLNNFVKLVNPEVLPYGNKKIVLQDNYENILYSTNQQFIKEFEEKNSITPMGKPMTGRLAILARNNAGKSKHSSREALSFAAMMDYGKRGFKLNDLNEEYETYMAASIRFIEHFDKENAKVSYTITDYTEITTSFIADGFYLCLGALLKEYREKYPLISGMPPSITFERDPNSVPSSTLRGYIEKGTLTEIDPFTKFVMSDGKGNTQTNIEYKQCYVKLSEMRTKEEDSYRQDCRLFYPSTLIARMGDDLKASGITSGIRDAAVRRKFIKDQGYVPCKMIEVKEYMVAFDKLFELMYNASILSMQKLPDVDALMPLGGIVDTKNISENPFLMMKFMNLMNSDDPYAKDMINKMVMGQMMGNTGFNNGSGFEGDNGFLSPEMMQMQMMMQMFSGNS